MNYIDLLLALLIAGGAAIGWRTGFILGVLDLVRWMGSLLLAVWLYQYAAHPLATIFGDSAIWVPALAFLLTGIAAGALLGYLERMLLQRISPQAHPATANRALGLLPGAVNGLIGAAVAGAFLLAMPLPEPVRTVVRNSSLANLLASWTDRLEDVLAPAFDGAIVRTLNRIIPAESEETKSIRLPFTVAHPRPRPDLETGMLDLLNRERRDAGLRPLVADTALRAVAREHSADMFARGYFSHLTPEGLTPFDRIDGAHIRYRAAGENLALAPTVMLAHSGLMSSPGHRANILRAAYGRVGIGILDGGPRGVMVTQEFRN